MRSAVSSCKVCGAEYISQRRVTQQYCSITCRGKGQSSSLVDRFWPKVNKDGPIPPHRPELGPCWIFTGYCDRDGYGKIGAGDGTQKALYANRVAYEIQVGPIPDGFQALHHCDNPPCCRDTHLFLGTNMDNILDRMAKGRSNGGRNPWRGSQNSQSKLMESQVLFIRQQCADGATQTSLAQQFSVSRGLIHNIIWRKCWSHI